MGESEAEVVPSRVVVPIALTGGLLALAALLVPGFVLPTWWARAVMSLVGLATLGVGWVAARVGMSARLLFGCCLGADVAMGVSVLTLGPQGTNMTTVATLALPTVIVALYCSPGRLIVQGLVSAVCASVVLTGGELRMLTPVLLLQMATAGFACSGPAVAVFVIRRRMERMIQHERERALTDPLTGAVNRRGLQAAVPRLVAESLAAGLPIGVVAMDVDHFKRVNDEFGHGTGDVVLQRVARTLLATVRGRDVVARMGGEEFAVLAVLSPDDLAALGERLRREVARSGPAPVVTVSVGVAWRSFPQETPAQAMEGIWSLADQADGLMYAAKGAGRNQVRLAVRV